MLLNQENIRMSSNYKKTIGIIGIGYWGKNLVRVFYKIGVLKIICDSDKKILIKRKKEYLNLKTTTNFSELLRDKEIRGIVIATPAATHYKLTKRALLAGKDVFVEKPLALKITEGEELVSLAKKKKQILMVGHLLLYHPAVVRLIMLAKTGMLGEIYYIWSNRLNFGKMRREENVLWSFAPHDISIIINILGMPKTVRALGQTYLQKNIPDTTLSFLEFDKKETAHIFVSWLNPFKEQRLSVIGSRAMAVFDDQAKDELIMYRHKVKFQKNKNIETLKVKGKVIKVSGGTTVPLLEEARHFLECITKRKNPKTDGLEALNVLRVLEACQKSLNKNGKKILVT